MAKVNFLIQFSKQACELARVIYNSIVDKFIKNWYYALKLAWAYIKGVKKGVLSFRISATETISVRIEKMIDDFASGLSVFIKDTDSDTCFTLSIYDLAA